MDEMKETQPKKKGSSKAKKHTEEPIVDAGDMIKETTETTVETVEEPVEAKEETVEEPVEAKEEPVEEKEETVEEPVEAKEETVEEPVEAKEEPVEAKEEPVDEKEEPEKEIVRKKVPSTSELRKNRKFNESIFRFNDGFACTATSIRTAETQHKKWLSGE